MNLLTFFINPPPANDSLDEIIINYHPANSIAPTSQLRMQNKSNFKKAKQSSDLTELNGDKALLNKVDASSAIKTCG